MRAIDRLLRNRPVPKAGLSLAGKIKALFSNGEQGWWYDPSNFATLFQDSAGTTPVTAVEQPVGLQLDLSKGLVLGPELVVNGDFSNGTTGWTAQGSVISVVGDKLQVVVSVTSGYAWQELTTVAGKRYKCSVSITSVSGSTAAISVGTSFSDVSLFTQTSIAEGVFTFTFVATTTTSFILLQPWTNGTGRTTQFDNVAVKELPGNHRFQTTSANCPVVSVRVNLLTKTEDFSDAVWTKNNVTVTANSGVAPNGTNTATLLTDNATSGEHRVFQSLATAGLYSRGVYAKAGTANFISLTSGTVVSGYAVFDLSSGTVVSQSNAIGSIISVGNGWYWCSTNGAPLGQNHVINMGTTATNAIPTNTYVGSGSTVFIWGADLRPTNQGIGLPAYQRVNTSTDYDSTGFPVYIKPNGSNQFMQTNSINFSATDKMTVWQGVRKLTDGMAFEVSAIVSGNSGTFYMFPFSDAKYYYGSNGTSFVQVSSSAITPPRTNTLTGISNISGDVVTLRVDGVQVATSSADQGTGNYGNYPVYFYSRAGSTLFLNGHDYGSIARGAASTAAQITAGETYINSKTRAFA